jgi:hypothetical protein
MVCWTLLLQTLKIWLSEQTRDVEGATVICVPVPGRYRPELVHTASGKPQGKIPDGRVKPHLVEPRHPDQRLVLNRVESTRRS